MKVHKLFKIVFFSLRFGDFFAETSHVMKKIDFNKNSHIYLFTQVKNSNSSSLNEFMAFLKFNRSPIPYKFAFVEATPTLMNELSLNQNITIDFSGSSLTENKEVQFQEFLTERCNQKLKELYKEIEAVAKLQLYVDTKINKVTALIKALLKEADFIFLESPELSLDYKALNLFVSALKHQVQTKHQNIFIYSQDVEFWKIHADHVITRNEQQSFECTKIEEKSNVLTDEITSKIIKINQDISPNPRTPTDVFERSLKIKIA